MHADREENGATMLAIAEEMGRESGARWAMEPSEDPTMEWIRLLREDAALPAQGFKLHVSAGVSSAEEVLRRALPVLLAERVTFKVAGSRRMLAALNQGMGGMSQIGKFITVYPGDDAQAVRLAAALDGATRGLCGPVIPSDRALRPGSLVHYRYGAFKLHFMQTPVGHVVPAICAPGGELLPDRRTQDHAAPAWVKDPFVEAGVAVAAGAPSRIIAGRYLLLSRIHRSVRSSVLLAVDITLGRRCVLKRAEGEATRAAETRLRHEAEVLALLAPDPRFPTPFGIFEHDEELYLAMEDVEGETLGQYIGGLSAEGRHVSADRVVAWGRELASALGYIHARGLAYRDLKSSNVIVTPEEELRLIDFDIAHPLEGSDKPHGLGTLGYMSPQQAAGAMASVDDDIHGLGALLYFMATGAEPSLSPRPQALLDRPIARLNPSIGEALAHVVKRCLAPDRALRFASIAEVEAALAAIGRHVPVRIISIPREPAGEPEDDVGARARALARRLGDRSSSPSSPGPGGRTVPWTNAYRMGPGAYRRDIDSGAAGAVLALAELVVALGVPAHRAALEERARWLLDLPRPGGAPVPGLYVGEAGIVAAVLRAGQALGDPELVARAAERGRFIASLPHGSPDLFNGTAGRLRAHLLLAEETGEPEPLGHAVACGEALLSAAAPAGQGLCFPFPAGYDELSHRAYPGYAHGAAGIGDALLDLFQATGQERFLEAARGAAAWLESLAVPALDDGSGVAFPMLEGGPPTAAFWCHGATGIGRFFLHMAEVDALPGAAELALKAARSAAHGARWAGPCRCHGLSGNIDFLLDVHQVLGDRVNLAEAFALARLLLPFAEACAGETAGPSGLVQAFKPAYMVGFAGVAACLSRLASPGPRPYGLDRLRGNSAFPG
jgi:hypothetical protein